MFLLLLQWINDHQRLLIMMSLLTAYPHWHWCHKLGTIPADKIICASPQSWISQETPLPQAFWNLHIIAVWSTAARLHLSKHNPTWLQNLAFDIPEANWHLNDIAFRPICNARHAETAPHKIWETSLGQNANYQVLPQTCFG